MAETLFERLAVGQTPPIAAEPVTLVIFGGAGDLAHRKLLPALYNLHVDGLLPPRFAVVGVGRKDDDRRRVPRVRQGRRRAVLAAPARRGARGQTFADVAVLRQRAIDRRADGVRDRSASRLDIDRARARPAGQPHLLPRGAAVAVRADGQAARARAVRRAAGSTRPFARLIVEKPIGHDLESACEINDAIAEVFDERQIYRIDHYLGKETVQNILVLRFANSIFEPLFNQKYIDHVQITVAEEEGVGTRAGYYEQAGALRDMVQNHMLQLLALVAMEPPHSLDADVVRDEKLEVLQSLRPIDRRRRRRAASSAASTRAGFDAGRAGAGLSRGERASTRSRATETFVALQLFIDNWRWAGVPFFLRTGKRLPKRASEISIQSEGGAADPVQRRSRTAARCRTCCRSAIQPDEGFALGISSKMPGPRVRDLSGEDGFPLRQHVRRHARRRPTNGCCST